LGGGVEDRPVEPALLRLKVGPGDPQIHRRHTGEIIDSIGRFELAAVVEGNVVVMMQDPAHAGIHEGDTRILRVNDGCFCAGERGAGRRERNQ